jgi:hypothetical protein
MAAYMGLSIHTVRRYVAAHGFPVVRLNNQVMTSERLIDAWIERMIERQAGAAHRELPGLRPFGQRARQEIERRRKLAAEQQRMLDIAEESRHRSEAWKH